MKSICLLFATVFFILTLQAQTPKTESISIPSAPADTKDTVLISNFLLKSIISGKLKVYADKECKVVKDKKAVLRAVTDTFKVKVFNDYGDIIKTKKVTKLIVPDTLTQLGVVMEAQSDKKAEKAKNTIISFAYSKPVFSSDGILVGTITIFYIKLSDMNEFISAFEKKYYNVHYTDQINKIVAN